MSNERDESDDYDLNHIMIKPLYFGLFVNVLVPAGLLLICYYFTQTTYVANKVGAMENTLYWVLGLMAVVQAAVAIWWRNTRLGQPMIRRRETFEQDLTVGLLRALRPVFLLISGIAGYGLLYFFMTGRFEESLFLVLLSFLAFQVVRPRLSSMRKLIESQRALVEAGQFFTGL